MKRSKAILICLAAVLGVGALTWLGTAPRSAPPSAPAVEVTPGPSQGPSAPPSEAPVVFQPPSAAPDGG